MYFQLLHHSVICLVMLQQKLSTNFEVFSIHLIAKISCKYKMNFLMFQKHFIQSVFQIDTSQSDLSYHAQSAFMRSQTPILKSSLCTLDSRNLLQVQNKSLRPAKNTANLFLTNKSLSLSNICQKNYLDYILVYYLLKCYHFENSLAQKDFEANIFWMFWSTQKSISGESKNRAKNILQRINSKLW